MTRDDIKKNRELAMKWRDARETFGECSAEFIADSLAQRLIRALDALEAELDKPRPRTFP